MNYLGRIVGNLKGLYSGINGATLTGAIDVVVVEQEDGTFKCSPFHVRFGKLGVLRSREKVVDIIINGVESPIRMKLGDSGEAFFVQEVDDEFDDEFVATSPLPASPQLSDSDNRTKRSETEESGDDGLKKLIDVNIKVIEDPAASPSVTPLAEQVPIGAKGDDSKNRKRRRKRRKNNQGSKSNIVVDPTFVPENDNQTETSEAMFKMDEELSVDLREALEGLEASGHNQSVNLNRSYHRDFYSDTEVDVSSTPKNSRPSTPIQSDSEYEFSKIPQKGDDEDVNKWPWGELPSTGSNTPAVTPMAQDPSTQSGNSSKSNLDDNPLSSDDESAMASGRSENKSFIGGMFSFISKRHSSGNGNSSVTDSTPGIYLDDLNFENMDPEVAALYFPNLGKDSRDSSKREIDEDVESGKGSSLPQSPAPGSSPKGSQLSVYMEEDKRRQEPSSGAPKFEAISICGSSLGLFEQSQLTFDELIENPDIILNTPPESIVVKIDGKMVPWSAALPQLLSTTFFKRPIPNQIQEKLITQHSKKDELPPASTTGSHEPVQIQRSNSVTSGNSKRAAGYSWFPWRRSNNPSSLDGDMEQQGESHALLSSGEKSPNKDGSTTIEIDESDNFRHTLPVSSKIASVPSATQIGKVKSKDSSSSDESEGEGGQPKIRPNRNSSQPSPAHKPIPPPISTSINIGGSGNNTEKFKKSLRLTTDQIVSLGLRNGQNEAVFSVTTAYQGTTVARCHIYLWRYDDRVVVSDIDGTITKSDVLGHILPIIGNDWAQSGVAQLFTQIQDNGYKMLYLSARAIGQAAITRDYLRSIKQGDVTLPDGPLLLNPTSLMSALHREVIEKKPEEFKIACLRDIQTLFPSNPFYAGYGNKINDVWAYRAVEIAIPRIFTINHKGELRHALTNTFQSSYTSLVELAEFIFPAYKIGCFTSTAADTTDGFNDFEFWRAPVADLSGIAEEDIPKSSTDVPV